MSDRFSVPGAEFERGLEVLEDRMGDRSDGAFTLVATGVSSRAEVAATASMRGDAARRLRAWVPRSSMSSTFHWEAASLLRFARSDNRVARTARLHLVVVRTRAGIRMAVKTIG